MKKRKRRPTITINLGNDGVAMLDTLIAWMQQIQESPARITRSGAMREALQALYDRFTITQARRRDVEKT